MTTPNDAPAVPERDDAHWREVVATEEHDRRVEEITEWVPFFGQWTQAGVRRNPADVVEEIGEACERVRFLLDHISALGTHLATARAESARLAGRVTELEADTRRLDAVERFALAAAGDDGSCDAAEVRRYPDDDAPDHGPIVTEWTVAGVPEWFGRRLGEGPTLRAAIDDALAKEALPRAIRPSFDAPDATEAHDADA